MNSLEKENKRLRAELAEARKLTGSYCYCGIPNDACDGWKGGLCDSARFGAPEGGADRLRAQLQAERERVAELVEALQDCGIDGFSDMPDEKLVACAETGKAWDKVGALRELKRRAALRQAQEAEPSKDGEE